MDFKRLQGVKRGYRRLQRISGGYMGLQRVTEDYSKLQGITNRVHVVTKCYKRLQRVARG